MAADPQRQEAPSNDLFGRWLAHHNEQQSGEQGEQTESAEDTSEAPSASRRLPAAAVASSAVERDPLIGSRITPPSTFGVRKSAANAPQKSGPGNEADREPASGWEPIVMRSIRKKTEQAEAKHVPKPVDTRSRMQRLKARLVDAPEPEVEVETPLVPLAPPVARSVPLPVATSKPPRTSAPSTPDAPAPPAARSLEETIRAAVPTIERPVARHSEPRAEEKPDERTVEQPVEQHAGRHVGRHAQPQVEQAVELAVEQVAPVARQVEPEEVATPRPVRAFIDAAPVTRPEPEPYVAPEPVVVEPEPVFEPEPEPLAESVAESVVVEAEPEPTEDHSDGFSFLSMSRRQPKLPEPVAFAEPAIVVERVVEPVVEPVTAPAPVVAATIELEPTEAAEPTEPAAPTQDQPAKRSFLSLPRRQPKAPEPVAESVDVEAEPEPEPEPVAFAEPAAVIEPVVIEPDVIEPDVIEPDVIEPDVAPAPVVAATIEVEPTALAEPTEPTEPTKDRPATRSLFSLSRRQPKEPKPRESGLEDRPRTGDAARDLVAAKARARATGPALPPVPVAEPVAEPVAQPVAVAVAAPPEPEVEQVKVSKHDEVATEMPGLYKFAAKRTSRRLLTISLLIGTIVSAYFVRAAVEVKDTPSIGLAAIVVLATVMVWAIRSGASVTTLEVHQGQLQVIQQGGRFIFDLASQYTRFEVHGEPGHRGWKVLFPRRGMAPFTVDASMVDPDDFMRVLRFFRPQLVTH